MSYTAGFEYDVFVSYAVVDDTPLTGVATGWVTAFVRSLESQMAVYLGRAENVSVWWDRTDLCEEEKLSTQIAESLKKTATLLVILSPAYIASDWCREEREVFLQAVRSQADSDKRIFLVDLGRLETSERPLELADFLPFKFWKEDETGRRTALGYPLPSPLHDRDYYAQLDHLAHRLCLRLRQIESKTGDQTDPLSETPTATRQLSTAPKEDARPHVFLAQPSDDVDFDREAVASFLDLSDFHVIPDIPYPSELTACQAAIDTDLKRCTTFAQLLGLYPGKRVAQSDMRLVQLQFERARAAGLNVLQWRSPDLILDDIRDPDHRALVESPSVMICPLEAFKSEVRLAATPQREPEAHPSRSGEIPFIFVNTGIEDQTAAMQLTEALEQLGCFALTPMVDASPAEIRDELEENIMECDGLIMLYGEITPRWVREQLRQTARLLAKRRVQNQPLRGLALCTGPPDSRPPANYSFPGMQMIDCRDGFAPEDLRDFIQSLRTSTAASHTSVSTHSRQ